MKMKNHEYWDRGFKNNKGILTGEDEVMDALYNAIQMDFDIHEVLNMISILLIHI